jgi:transcriptional regulator with XRE-family HTH domain
MQSDNLGKFLEALRGRMSLREAAHKSGLSHAYIRDLELEKNRSTNCKIKPSPETLRKLSEAYGFSYIELLRRAGYLIESHGSHPAVTIDLHQFLFVEVSSKEITYHADDVKVIKSVLSLVEFTEFLEALERYGFKKIDNDLFVNLHQIRMYSEHDGRIYFDEGGRGQYVTVTKARQKILHLQIIQAVNRNNIDSLNSFIGGRDYIQSQVK